MISFKNCGDLEDLVPKELNLTFLAHIVYDDTLPDEDHALNMLVSQIRAVAASPLACITGAETGVKLGDRLSEKLGLRTNGSHGVEARRNKYLMGTKRCELCVYLETMHTRHLAAIPNRGSLCSHKYTARGLCMN